MLGQSVISGSNRSSANNRVFVYEVTGLRQNQVNDSNDYAFRQSSSTFISVPYHRMNAAMQSIGKMGGTITNIQSLEAFQQSEAVISLENTEAISSDQSEVAADES